MAYDSKRQLSRLDTPNRKSKIAAEGQTKALVQKIKSSKKMRLNDNDEAEIIQEQRKILQKSWKPWIVGDFEKKKRKVKLQKLFNETNQAKFRQRSLSKSYASKSLIPKSVAYTPEFRASIDASIPELLLKKANVEKDLKVLKSLVSDAGKNPEFDSRHYCSKYKRENQVSIEEANKQKNKINVQKAKKEIYNGRTLKNWSSKGNCDNGVKKFNAFGGIHKSTFQTHRRKVGRRPKQTLASASTHYEAERMLQQSFLLRYMANGPDSKVTVEAKNALLHCYKVLRRGNEYMDLKKNPGTHVLRLREILSSQEDDKFENKIENNGSKLEITKQDRRQLNEKNYRKQTDSFDAPSASKTTDWVIGTLCKQIIELKTPNSFDENAYFRVHLGVCKTPFIPWNINGKKLAKAMEIFKDYEPDLCDIKVTKLDCKTTQRYEWEVTMTSRTPSIPLLQIWTPDGSPLQFLVNWISGCELARKTKYEKNNFSEATDVPKTRRLITPKRIISPKAKERLSPTSTKLELPNDKYDEKQFTGINSATSSPRHEIKKALQVGAFKEASSLSIQVMEQNGISPAPLRIFRSALEKVTVYPRRNDFKVQIQLDSPSCIVVGSKLRVKYRFRHLIEKDREHDALDWLGIYFLPQYESADLLVAKANVPMGNDGTVLFDGISETVGTYEIRYYLKGSECQVGKPRRYVASHPLVKLHCPKNISINGTYEIPVNYQYILGGEEMTVFDNDQGDWLGIYPLQAPIHDLFGQVDHNKPIKLFHLKSCSGAVKFQGVPRFPGKYEIRVESGLFKNVILGTFGPIIVDAVSEIPSYQTLIDTREISFYLSAPLHGVTHDKIFFYKHILPYITQLCDERRVLFSVIDLHLEKCNLEQRNHQDLIDLGIKKLIECRPYGLYLLPNSYGRIPNTLSVDLIDDFPWLKSYDKAKPGCGISISELELMIGLIIPQFQHDIIAANSIACLQDINYTPIASENIRINAHQSNGNP
eukprot:g8531.t1